MLAGQHSACYTWGAALEAHPAQSTPAACALHAFPHGPVLSSRSAVQGQDVAIKAFKAENTPDGRAQDEVDVACCLDDPHLIR